MKELVEFLGRELVDNPTHVSVEETCEGDDASYKLRVGREDLGKVIGKKGRTAKALRTLLAAAGAKQNLNVTLEIVEPDAPKAEPEKAQKDAAPAADAAPAQGPEAASADA